MTNTIIALIDGSAFARPVLDLAAWAATRNEAPVHLLHVLPPKPLPKPDLSGEIGLGARSTLLSQLATLDEQRAGLAMVQGRALLDDATARLEAAGVSRVTSQLRQGDLLESVAAQEHGGGLLVLGKRGETADQARGHLGSNFERLLRAAKLPVLMAPRQMPQIRRATIAYDGSPSARRAVERVTRLPAYRGIEIEIVRAGNGPEAEASLAQAQTALAQSGITATTQILPGAPEAAILAHLRASGSDFLVMGAYGHSRIRSLVVGSTTTAILQKAQVPVLLVR
ncbi:universal stress protein [Paracoccus sp. Z118]|uniref:universal stress protein n=1 Tax=Paracoccus sp. Z118 TaxID=2851017 RepID=UPI001C2C5A8C|nr:universal stress protein [Paracoccus sp. Z118]